LVIDKNYTEMHGQRNVRFVVLVHVAMEITVSWDVTPSILILTEIWK